MDHRMRILFIKLRHIGDSLLLTPTIVATKQKYPHAEIWVLVRESCDGILAGCPEIDRILKTANPDTSKRTKSGWLSDLQLAAHLRRTHFDFVFELTDNDRARFLALAARTPMRCTNRHPRLKWHWKPFFTMICQTKRYKKHQVVRDYTCPREVLNLPDDPPPLRFAKERMRPWHPAESLEPRSYAVIHLHTRWERKAWPIDRWEALAARLLEFIPRIILSCGPDAREIEESRLFCAKFGGSVLSTLGSAHWPELAWILHRASFFVGVDTAAMHLSAACQCPTVALFGPSPLFEYHPWSVPNHVVRPPCSDEKSEAQLNMRDIALDEVLAACQAAHSGPRGGASS